MAMSEEIEVAFEDQKWLQKAEAIFAEMETERKEAIYNDGAKVYRRLDEAIAGYNAEMQMNEICDAVADLSDFELAECYGIYPIEQINATVQKAVRQALGTGVASMAPANNVVHLGAGNVATVVRCVAKPTWARLQLVA